MHFPVAAVVEEGDDAVEDARVCGAEALATQQGLGGRRQKDKLGEEA